MTTVLFDDRDDRLRRLRCAVDMAAKPASGADAHGEQELSERLAPLLARVKAFTLELSRSGSVDLDAVDVLTATMLLNEVAQMLRTCRGATALAEQRIRAADESVRHIARALERGRQRLEGSGHLGAADQV